MNKSNDIIKFIFYNNAKLYFRRKIFDEQRANYLYNLINRFSSDLIDDHIFIDEDYDAVSSICLWLRGTIKAREFNHVERIVTLARKWVMIELMIEICNECIISQNLKIEINKEFDLKLRLGILVTCNEELIVGNYFASDETSPTDSFDKTDQDIFTNLEYLILRKITKVEKFIRNPNYCGKCKHCTDNNMKGIESKCYSIVLENYSSNSSINMNLHIYHTIYLAVLSIYLDDDHYGIGTLLMTYICHI